MKKLFLIGGMGAGKSTARKALTDEGLAWIDLDQVGHEVLTWGTVKDDLRGAFGDGVFDEGGEVVRAELAAVAFASPAATRKLNCITMPRIEERYTDLIDEFEHEGKPAVVVEYSVFRNRQQSLAYGADVVIAATSAPSPYLTARHLEGVSLYCHIGFHEIAWEAVDRFDSIVVDAWEEAKAVSGQSLFRYYREGLLPEERITGKLGAIVSGTLAVPRAAPGRRVMFDAFGLPIFDLSVAKAAYLRAREMGLGTSVPW